jgi:hypothetical protein
MSTSKLSQLIQYYRQCYQASFHSSEGHGIFDRDDVVPLAVYSGDSSDAIHLTESQLSSWLVDSDQTELVLFSGFMLYPTPNKSFTTEVHYAPLELSTTAHLISKSLSKTSDATDPHLLSMMRSIDLEELNENSANYDDLLVEAKTPLQTVILDQRPEPKKMNRWLVKQAKLIKEPVKIKLKVLALVPKDLRSYRAKEAFVGHLDSLAEDAQDSGNFRLLGNLLQREPSESQSPENIALLNKGAALGFGKKLALPSLSSRQAQAVENAIKYRVSLVQGPPGTGKSHALTSLAIVLASLNKSVLMTAQNDAALDVLHQQLVDTMNVDRDLIVRFGKGQRHGRFSQQIKRLIKRLDRVSNDGNVVSSYQSLLDLFEEIKRKKTVIESSIEDYPIPSEDLLLGKGRIGERFKRWFFWQRQHRKQDSLLLNIQALYEAIRQHHASLGDVASAVLKQRFQRAYSRDSESWGIQAQNIGKHSVNASANLLKNNNQSPSLLQSGLGVWLATLDDIPECTYGNFDWVIIDEATQINMASVLPAVAIANSLIVSGDPKQLRHYSFLSNAQEERIEEQLGLQGDSVPKFRKTSFFDFVHESLMLNAQTRAITLLDEHYRSVPPLMQFNSEHFYDDDVKVLTGLASDSVDVLHLNWQYLKGQRIDKVNKAEVDAVVNFLKSLIMKQAENGVVESIGVLSFFTDQTEALKKEILCELSLQQIKDHRIKVGTPFSFQGAERDHMLISCAVDESSVAGTWTYLNRPDVFNVATSRARTQQTLFLSVPPRELPSNSILRRYHDFSVTHNTSVKADFIEPWLSEMIETLVALDENANINIEHSHKIADIEIDLLLQFNNRRLAIDLIGFPGTKGVAVHLSRYTALERVGISLYPLTAFDWMFKPEEVKADLKVWLHQDSNRLNKKIGLPSTKPTVPVNESKVKPSEAHDRDSAPMQLVNDHVWQEFLECVNAPELSAGWGFNLGDMSEKLMQMDQLLPKLFKSGSITFMRYKSAINSALTPYLDNLSTYRLLHAQVWEADDADHSYWKTLTHPIYERHAHITDALIKLHRDMQIEVAKGGDLDEFALADIEELSTRLKKY